MPRYFFNVHDGENLIDEDGLDLPDIGEALQEAVAASGRIIMDRARKVQFGEEWRMEVSDECGAALFFLDFQISPSFTLTSTADELFDERPMV